MLRGILVVFGLGIAYFLAAIPTGVAMKLPVWVAAVSAWGGYTAIAAAMLLVGAPAREWLNRRFKVSPHPDPKKLFWRVWLKGGLPGLGLLAPITCGPYFAALIALALGEKPARLMWWIGVGGAVWCVIFSILAASGVALFKPQP